MTTTAQHTRVVLLNVDVTHDGEGDVGQAATTLMALFPCDGRRRGRDRKKLELAFKVKLS